jgi:glutaconyl-CoA/methylmalonyl-CoA decarboxylase subunit gamma
MAKVTIGGRTYEVMVHGNVVVVDGHEFPVKVRDDFGYHTVSAGGVQYRVALPPEGARNSGMTVEVDHRPMVMEYDGALGAGSARPKAAARGGASRAPRAGVTGGVAAQIAGRVITVRVKVGDAVKAGDVMLLLEAMKMENEIKAPADGTVKEVLVKDGDRVSEGDTLIVIE